MLIRYYKKNKNKGFTLLELVVVMAMIGILSLSTLKLVRFSDTYQKLGMMTVELKGMFRTAQTLALSPPIKRDDSGKIIHICGFGVRTPTKINSEDRLEIFYAYPIRGSDLENCRRISDINRDVCDGGLTECDIYEEKVFDGFTIKQNINNDVKIFFRAPYGKVIGENFFTITQNKNNYSRSIEINKYGKINIKK